MLGEVEFEVRQGEAEVRSGEVEVSPREVEPHIHKCCPGFAIPSSFVAIVWLFALPQGEIPLYIFKVFELPLLLDDQRFYAMFPTLRPGGAPCSLRRSHLFKVSPRDLSEGKG